MDQIPYNIYLVYKFQPAIMNECKVIRKQTLGLTHFEQYSQINLIYFMMDHNIPTL